VCVLLSNYFKKKITLWVVLLLHSEREIQTYTHILHTHILHTHILHTHIMGGGMGGGMGGFKSWNMGGRCVRYGRIGRLRERVRGVYRFSSLMKKKSKK